MSIIGGLRNGSCCRSSRAPCSRYVRVRFLRPMRNSVATLGIADHTAVHDEQRPVGRRDSREVRRQFGAHVRAGRARPNGRVSGPTGRRRPGARAGHRDRPGRCSARCPRDRVSGIELSEPMVDQLQRKVPADELPVVVGDMATAIVPGEFSLVYVVWNSIGNLRTQDEQVQCFANAARHLAPGGRFVIELWSGCRVSVASRRARQPFPSTSTITTSGSIPTT